MDKNKIIAMVVGLLLAAAGAFTGYNYKADVCGTAVKAPAVAQ
jgi:hypothetical protein